MAEVIGMLLIIVVCAVVGRTAANMGARIAENQEVEKIRRKEEQDEIVI